MALDDFTDIDDETLGGLGDLFDLAVPEAPPARPAQGGGGASAPEVAGTDSFDDKDFLDDPSIDDELLSSVEDVLSELDDLETSEEELFGLHAELGAPQRAHKAGPTAAPDDDAVDDDLDDAAAFPDIHPVEAEAFAFGDVGAAERRAPFARPARAGWLPTAAVLAANFVLLLFAWNASSSLRSGLQDVRDELDEVRSTAQAPDVRAIDTRGVAGLAGDAAAHGELRGADETPAHGTTPLPAFDQVALEIAQRELERGLYPSARRRLYGVLAVADRIDPERRADVEARLAFLIADSYRIEAELQREVAQ